MNIHPFKPIIEKDAKVLILGSFPSLKSVEDNFYYAHPRNQFWKFFRDIFHVGLNDDREKIEFCKNKKIALWDVVKSCERKNSSDTNLKNVEVNDFNSLLKNYKEIEKIYFTGKTAEKFFKKEYKDLTLFTMCLPSPSPAYMAMKYEDKLKIYKEEFGEL